MATNENVHDKIIKSALANRKDQSRRGVLRAVSFLANLSGGHSGGEELHIDS